MLLKTLMILAIFYLKPTKSAIRTWIGGNDAILKTPEENCRGLQLPDHYQAVILLSSQTIHELILPSTGAIALQDGARLTFDIRDKSCSQIKLIKTNENRPENWNNLNNRAIPYLDRLPCQWDAILIPQTDIIGIISVPELNVKSLKLFNRELTVNEKDLHLFGANINPDNTCDRTTCVCQKHSLVDDRDLCTRLNQTQNDDNVYNEEYPNDKEDKIKTYTEEMYDDIYCENPTIVWRNCRRICGASIILTGKSDFLIKKIESLLKDEGNNGDIDYYYGLVNMAGPKPYGQFVIVDKMVESGGRYTQGVVEKLKKMLNKVEIDSNVYYNIITSGEPIVFRTFANSGGAMVLITFALTVLVFLGIYMVFMTPVKDFDIRNFRLNPANFRPFIFARFDNAGDASDAEDDDAAILRQSRGRVDITFTPTIDPNTATARATTMSLQSSVLSASTAASSSESDNANVVRGEGASLERRDCAFDNPLYGQMDDDPTTTTPSSSTQTQSLDAERKVKTKKGKKGTSRKHSHAFEQLLRDEVDDDGEKDDQEMSDLHERMQGTKYEDEEEQKTQKEGEILEEEVTGVDPREEMLRIIEENMQQVNLLDEQL